MPSLKDVPSFQDVLEWWHLEGGRIECLGRLRDFFDIYEAPSGDSASLRICKVGPRSLSSKTLGVASEERLQGLLNALPPQMAVRVSNLHRKCQNGEICTDVEHAQLDDPDTKKTLNLTYSRLLLPLKDKHGRSYTLNYSREISPEYIAHA